jgi:hypothetical protein
MVIKKFTFHQIVISRDNSKFIYDIKTKTFEEAGKKFWIVLDKNWNPERVTAQLRNLIQRN